MFAARSARRPRRWLVGTVATVLVALLAPAAPAMAAEPIPLPASTGMTDKGTGQLSAADRDFVVKVRLAGLWEIPAGNMAQEKSEDPRVRAIGKAIAEQHVTLDKLDVAAAKKLGIALPVKPNAQQEGWLAEMRAANSTTFDQIFVDRLRAAHGNIFPAIGTIRSSTRNDAVRKLAQEANQFVMTHLTLLESTGLVDYRDDVPNPPDPAPLHLTDLAPVEARAGAGGAPAPLIWTVLSVALLAGGIALTRVVRPG